MQLITILADTITEKAIVGLKLDLLELLSLMISEICKWKRVIL